jgi:hypothetical protein
MKKTLILATQTGLKRFRRVEDFWEETGHALTGLPVTSLTMRDRMGLAGTEEGIFITRDGGNNWVKESQGIHTPHVRWLAIHPQDPRFFFVGTEPANIYTRMEADSAWKEAPEVSRLRDEHDWFMPYSPNPGCVRGFAFHQNRIYAAVEVGGLLSSSDYGGTWQLVPGSSGKPRQAPGPDQIHPDVHSVATHASSADLIYAPTGGGFYRSVDGGTRWNLLYDCYCRAVWVDPADASHLLTGPADGVGRGGRIERSTDGGKTWHLAMDNLVEKWPEAMVERFLAADGELYAVLSNGKILVSQTGAFQWQYLLPAVENAVMLSLI